MGSGAPLSIRQLHARLGELVEAGRGDAMAVLTLQASNPMAQIVVDSTGWWSGAVWAVGWVGAGDGEHVVDLFAMQVP